MSNAAEVPVVISLAERLTDYAKMNKNAFIVGSSGMIGKELVKVLVDSKIFNKIFLLSRRDLDLSDDIKNDVEVKIVDFENLEASREIFNGMNVGYCCLGTTKAKAGSSEAFYKVDHDYVLNTAKIALDSGCEHFHLVSSQGANKNSFLLYPKTKGQVEEDVTALKFNRTTIYRPGALLGKREESRPMESVLLTVLKPLFYLSPTTMSTPALSVAKALLHATVLPSNNVVDVLDIPAIFAMADEKPGCNCN